MFHRNTSPFFPSPPSAFDYDTYSRPTTSPFSSLFTTPSSTHSHLDSYLPPSYDAYDLRRSRAEQLLLAQKQQERREAEQAAYLSRHRQLERQAAIEQAIREEREKRELEEALRYREEMVRRAREEEELKREYLREMEARKRRQAQLVEEQHRKRMIEEARNRQAQIDCQSRSQPQLDIGDLFKLFLGGPQPEGEKVESSKPIEPRKQTPSPAPTPCQIETPDLLRLLFGAPQSTSAPVPQQQSSVKEATIPQQPLPPIQVQAPSLAPSSKPSPQNDKEADAHSSDDEAATTVQRHFRRHLARRNALSKLSSLSSTFVDRQRTFEKPTAFVFQQSPSPSSDTSSPSAPALAYGSANSSFLSYEDFLVNLLSKIDAIESGGDRQVKTERKALVRKVEKELSRLDSMKERAWEQQVKEAQAKPNETEITEDEEMKELETATKNNNEVDLSASSPSPSSDNVETSTPAPTPVGSDPASSVELAEPAVESSIEPQNDSAADSSDVEIDNLEPLLPEPVETEAQQTSSPQLTKEALSSLAPPPSSEEDTSTAPSPNPPASESGSSTTSSTLTISTEDSPMSDLIEEVLRRAEKLGAEVEKLEVAELKNGDMERAESEKKKEEEYVVV